MSKTKRVRIYFNETPNKCVQLVKFQTTVQCNYVCESWKRINSRNIIQFTVNYFNLEMSDGIAFGGSAYTYANIFGSSGNIVIAANAYPAQTGSE